MFERKAMSIANWLSPVIIIMHCGQMLRSQSRRAGHKNVCQRQFAIAPSWPIDKPGCEPTHHRLWLDGALGGRVVDTQLAHNVRKLVAVPDSLHVPPQNPPNRMLGLCVQPMRCSSRSAERHDSSMAHACLRPLKKKLFSPRSETCTRCWDVSSVHGNGSKYVAGTRGKRLGTFVG
jgi:hypothetical protein